VSPDELEQRFAAIEERLSRVEARMARTAGAPPPKPATAPPRAPSQPREPGDRPAFATSVLGWGGAVALVLAAAYLIRLAVESGWLTPARQVGLAAISGIVLIAAGFVLRSSNRQYAGLLPAGGVAILFLSIYGAHLFYGFLTPMPAAAAVVLVCVLSLWLCRAFESDLYALFAVAGSYSAPVLIKGAPAMADLVIYFSAWSVVFSVFSIWYGRRLIYLLALYLALIVFDVMWHLRAPEAWAAALVFQMVQFAIFGTATIVFSIRNQSPLDAAGAWAHLPPLLIFYFLEYALLKQNLPQLAPWIAVASGVAVAGFYGVARYALKRPLPGGEFLLWAYVALVLFHAGYLEVVPDRWAPWVAFIAAPIGAMVTLRGEVSVGAKWPIWLGIALIFLVNYVRIVFDQDLRRVPGQELLAFAYALQLYAGYCLAQSREALRRWSGMLLYGGHVCIMSGALHLVSERIVESAAWGVIALVCLILSLWRHDRLLAQSSLFVFGAAAVKVMLYDLGGASPMARIVSLVVLGVTFYVGGLLYQRLLASAKP
jgi:uncharacterized membrane protein